MQRHTQDSAQQQEPTIGSVPYASQRLSALEEPLDGHGGSGTEIQEEGVVVAIEANGVWVETQRQSGCQSCSSRGNCGVGVLHKALNRRRHQVRVQTHLDVQVGDHVQLLLPAAALVQASVLMYLLPLLGLILGAITGQALAGTNAGSIAGAAIGFALVFMLIARQQTGLSRSGRYAPRIERVLFKSASRL